MCRQISPSQSKYEVLWHTEFDLINEHCQQEKKGKKKHCEYIHLISQMYSIQTYFHNQLCIQLINTPTIQAFSHCCNYEFPDQNCEISLEF